MISLVFWISIVIVGALMAALYVHGRLTLRVRALFHRAPVVYSELGLPPEVDLRPLLERPRLFYFALAAVGTSLRILLGLALFAAFEQTWPDLSPLVPAAAVLVALMAPELLSRTVPLRLAGIRTPGARLLRAIGVLARLVPDEETRTPSGREPDTIVGDIVTTVDGREVFDAAHKRFLAGLLSLRGKAVRQVMVPREAMVTVDAQWTASRAATVIRDLGHPRIPVIDGQGGDVVGLVHAKDIVLLQHSGQGETRVRSVMREVAYVSANQRLDRLLRDFQAGRIHLAVVRDDRGETCGLIGLDDVLRTALAEEGRS